MNNLATNPEAFYIKDVAVNSTQFYRMFNYHYATVDDFSLPDALEMRGIMFLMNKHDGIISPECVVSRPMEKFFNLNENKFTTGITDDDVLTYYEKLDGSLISTYAMVNENGYCGFGLKSKMSLDSEQALAATKLLNSPKYVKYYRQIEVLVANGYTVNFEYTSPNNRIVVPYQEDSLKVINIRNNKTGNYGLTAGIGLDFPLANLIPKDDKTLQSIYDEMYHEGYVALLKNGQRIKIKTHWYNNLHRLKSNQLNYKDLFISVVNEEIDDVKSAFHDDEYFMNRITKMEEFVQKKFSDIKHQVESFSKYKHLSRKDFALTVKSELGDDVNKVFGIVMKSYDSDDLDYKQLLIKNWSKIYKNETYYKNHEVIDCE